MIPNCASSVVLTQLYLKGVLSAGALMAGLLSGSGVGFLVLLRVNEDRRESLRIFLLLYGIGVGAGALTAFGYKLLRPETAAFIVYVHEFVKSDFFGCHLNIFYMQHFKNNNCSFYFIFKIA